MDIQVVVPVVARKKGMDEFYTSADGRQKKRPPSMIPEPVRGESSQPGKQMLMLFPLGHVLAYQKLHKGGGNFWLRLLKVSPAAGR